MQEQVTALTAERDEALALADRYFGEAEKAINDQNKVTDMYNELTSKYDRKTKECRDLRAAMAAVNAQQVEQTGAT